MGFPAVKAVICFFPTSLAGRQELFFFTDWANREIGFSWSFIEACMATEMVFMVFHLERVFFNGSTASFTRDYMCSCFSPVFGIAGAIAVEVFVSHFLRFTVHLIRQDLLFSTKGAGDGFHFFSLRYSPLSKKNLV